MRILFAGTPDIAVPSLERVAESFNVAGVLTGPDTQKGRGKKLGYSPVKKKALELGLPVLQPETLRRKARGEIAPLGADLLAVFAYGRIFGPKFLALFEKGGINVHPSLLPRYRGGSPIVAPLLNGDIRTGVVVQTIGSEVDAGDILGLRKVELTGKETGENLSGYMAEVGGSLLVEVLSDFDKKRGNAVEQNDGKAVFCRKLEKRDGRINWFLPTEMIERMIRAYIPWPKAYTFWNGKRLTFLSASRVSAETVCTGDGSKKSFETVSPGSVLGMDRAYGILIKTGNGVLGVKELQPEGKKAQSWKDFLNGNPDIEHAHLGDER